MRALYAVAVAGLIGCTIMAPSRAGTAPAAIRASAAVPPAACDEPGPAAHRAAIRPYRRPDRPHASRRHHRRWRPPPVALLPPPLYDAPIPSPWDSAYDRAMTLHFRSPSVAGLFVYEAGLPPTPPIRPVQPYRYAVDGTVFQYDGLAGRYIRLSLPDAASIRAALPPPPPR
jgi:hypothetical protein